MSCFTLEQTAPLQNKSLLFTPKNTGVYNLTQSSLKKSAYKWEFSDRFFEKKIEF